MRDRRTRLEARGRAARAGEDEVEVWYVSCCVVSSVCESYGSWGLMACRVGESAARAMEARAIPNLLEITVPCGLV